MTIVPKGKDFLPKYSKQDIVDLYRKEKNAKAKIRLLAAVFRKENMALKEISEKINYPFTTIGDWLRRMHLEGISRRYSIKQPGKPKRLTNKQLYELTSILSQSPLKQGIPCVLWTTKLIHNFIQERYGVSYKIRQIRNLLYQLRLSCQKPRPSHRKANKKLQEDFKKTSKKGLSLMWKTDMRSYFWMRVSSK